VHPLLSAFPAASGDDVIDSAFVTTLANFGCAGVVVVLMILGFLVPKYSVDKMEKRYQEYIERQEHTIARQQEALSVERRANAELRDAGSTTTQLIEALVEVTAKQALGRPQDHPPPGRVPHRSREST
jgi:hypothetical protein